ncbi:MAG: hypothetical protein NC206_03785 [Bacteroides sp.]|nr:hypothetical protein [Roseburia sp.]MCM1346188.1 hypothetical protein [Bacteroides sp.]MCM1420675.1 hypothetical protein [Bacteroides sp.]
MRIIEQFLQGKKSDRQLCEDEIVVTDDFVAVIDGSTSKGTERYTRKATGRVAADIVSSVLRSLVPADADMASAVNIVSEAIHDCYLRLGVLPMVERCPENRITASSVIYSRSRQEIWMIGDCQCMLDGKLYTNPKRIDGLLAEVRSLYHRLSDGGSDSFSSASESFSSASVDCGREFILPLLRKQCRLQNASADNEYAYGVFDGIGSPLPFCKMVPAAGVSEVVLASDGYPELFPTLSDSESYLARILDEDPMLISLFKATKGLMPDQCSFDDRAYIRFACNG